MNLSGSFLHKRYNAMNSTNSEEVENEELIHAIRWTYLAIVTIVFTLGCFNLLCFLIK